HLVPVVDGGVLVTVDTAGRMIGAKWRAMVAAPERKCLECSEQYLPELVDCERQGFAADPHYIEGLPPDHPLRGGENVFAFSAACGSLEVLQALIMLVAPCGISDIGLQEYQLLRGQVDVDEGGCRPGCVYSGRWLGLGEQVPPQLTGYDHRAAQERENLRLRRSSVALRISRRMALLEDAWGRWLERRLEARG
ncbi:MAG: hypothetical protein ACYCX3_01465, partial [Thermoleophilia bacterium]